MKSLSGITFCTRSRRRIVVCFVFPPIPVRRFDYVASYDGDEPDDDGNMDVGYGSTRELLENFPREAVR
jgi:hypothetical protein